MAVQLNCEGTLVAGEEVAAKETPAEEDKWWLCEGQQLSSQCGESQHVVIDVEDAASDWSTEPGSDSESHSEVDMSSAPMSREDTLIIFDWDDTLFPTTWIQQQGLMPYDQEPCEEQWANLHLLAEHSAQTLLEAGRHGEVVIVTNAQEGWVELSCARFMPSLASCLPKRITSARSTYKKYGSDPSMWKRRAFEREAGAFFSESSLDRKHNVISLGDSSYEREALAVITENMPNCRRKSLKFMEQPQVDQLITTHKLVSSYLASVASHDGDLDLQLCE